jgi:hypothetical protein
LLASGANDGTVNLWNATDGKCGIYLQEFGGGRGRLLLFFDGSTEDALFHFEECVLAHIGRRAVRGTAQLDRLFVCRSCGTPAPDPYVETLRAQGKDVFSCPCGGTVAIVDPRETLARRYPSQVESMDLAADRQRDFDAFVLSANAETHSSRLGGRRARHFGNRLHRRRRFDGS